jgi:hypothetical protein
MNKLVWVLTFVISCNVGSRFDNIPNTEYREKAISIGEIEYKSTKLLLFHFKNIGSNSIKIESISLSCSCISAEWPRNKIPHKGFGIIKVKVDTGHLGFFQERLIVNYAGRTILPDTLVITGNIVYHETD